MKRIIYNPDLTLISNNRYKEKLEITIGKNIIEFTAYVDNCGNSWEIKKNILKRLL